MTVLAVVVAASIGFTLVSQSTQVLRSEAAVRDGEQAARVTQELLRDVERELTRDPSRPLDVVLDDEAPRVCDPLGTVAAGEQWPDVCPHRWEYDLGPVEGEPYVTLTPPSRLQPALTVAATVTVGEETVVGERTYRSAAAPWALWSVADLDLSDLLLEGAGPHLPLSAPVYSAGTLTVPPSNMLDTQEAFLAAEAGFSGDVSDIPFRYQASPSAAEGDIRRVVPSPGTVTGLRHQFLLLSSAACAPPNRATSPSNTPTTVCLEAGADVPLAGGDTASFPDADAVLLLPTSSDTLQVFTASQLPPEPFCADCDLAAEVATSAGEGEHPAALDFWDLFGEVPYPHSGLLAAASDVYVGLCAEGVSSQSGSCSSFNTSGEGAVFDGTLTVLAGTPDLPADIYLSGPLLADPDQLSLVASSRFIIPFWARPVGEDLSLAANFVALGQGGSTPAFATSPTTPPGGEGGRLLVEGSLHAADLRLELGLFDELEFAPAPATYPHMLAGGGRWVEVTATYSLLD